MKRFIMVLLLLSLLFSSCAPAYKFMVGVYSIDELSSTDVFVYDLTTGAIYTYSDDNDPIVYPASTTKLLTSLVALEILPADTVIDVGEEVELIGEHSSIAYIRQNHMLTLEMLIEAMLIPSGNDATYVVATACGRELAGDDTLDARDAIAVFVERMNEYAIELGCENTHFTTPDGYAGDEHYTTVSDMARITRAAYQNQIIMKYTCLAEANVTYASGHTNTWRNSNLQLHKDSEFYNENVIGMKTGSLEDNYSLITAYNDGTTKLLIGVFGAPTKDDRYIDTANIIDAVLSASAKN
ncbi:MAG: D-alanyl-D-alanine carboxypeptidase [Ruminococcaceae bacterium]|nr:D-alanyl-D-alanine carboxypeptidase [Oscillospiraceae bacterium]